MKITALTGATGVALGAAAVALAAPASASAVLTQGSALSTPSGACSLTLVGQGVGYTAADCGAGAWTVGSTVRTADGEVAGHVAALSPASGTGLARIALAEDAEVIGDWSTRPAADVAADETVYTHGSSVPLGSANAISRAHSVCADADGSRLALDRATTARADRGGAVYDVDQRVVGVIAGTAPVTFAADGSAVPCAAGSLSSVFVPVEAITAEQAAPATGKARPAPKHAATTEEPVNTAPSAPDLKGATVGVGADELPTSGAASVADEDVKAYTPAEQDALAAELEARAAAHEHTVTSTRATSIARGARVAVSTPAPGGLASVTVTVRDGHGAVLGSATRDLDGARLGSVPMPATAPVGGTVTVTVTDASASPATVSVSLDGIVVR